MKRKVSATVLFGTGRGTAFHFWRTHRSGDVAAIAVSARATVLADLLFTLPAIVIQPITGVALALMAGYSLTAPWLLASADPLGRAGIRPRRFPYMNGWAAGGGMVAPRSAWARPT